MNIKGLVIKSTGSWYTVKTDDNQRLECKLKGRLRTENIKSTNPLVAGDYVTVEINDMDGACVISGLNPRKNYLIRRSINLSKQSHIIAANVDYAYLAVTFLLPETPMEFIDRFLVAAEAYSIPVCIIFNKIDLYTPSALQQVKEIESMYHNIGYQTIRTSIKTGEGIEQLKQQMAHTVGVISGLSGVGKSSLINAIDPDVLVKVGELSDYHQSGKHTTTFAEMIELKNGGYIIDTPGIRGFGLINIEKEELYHFFPEMFRTAEHCAFYNCLHINEPNCAVIQAVEEGSISLSRYNSYLSMMEDTHNKYR